MILPIRVANGQKTDVFNMTAKPRSKVLVSRLPHQIQYYARIENISHLYDNINKTYVSQYHTTLTDAK